MSYVLTHYNGTALLTLSDQATDDSTTSLTLIGKNVTPYGSDINENFIYLMENFANTSAPTSPLVGQLWYNTTAQSVYVYTSYGTWAPVGSPTVSSTQPTNLVTGNYWIDSTNNQLYFYNGSSLVLVGPSYSSVYGKSGAVVEAIQDSSGNSHIVTDLYSNGNIVGVISTETFVTSAAYNSTSSIVEVNYGITLNSSAMLYGTSSYSNSLTGIASSSIIVSTTTNMQEVLGQFAIVNDNGLILGSDNEVQLYINTSSGRVATLSVTNSESLSISASQINFNETPIYGVYTATNSDPTTTIANVGYVQSVFQSFPIAFSFSGKPTTSTQVQYVITQNLQVPANFANSESYVGTSPSSSAIFTISYAKSGTVTQFGTVTIDTFGNANYVSTLVNLTTGSAIIVTTPSVQDSTLENVGITIMAIR